MCDTQCKKVSQVAVVLTNDVHADRANATSAWISAHCCVWIQLGEKYV